MKDIINFPIVGSRFTENGLFVTEKVNVGDLLLLMEEPTNRVDPDAIKILTTDKVHLGYVPNKGSSCSLCYSYFDSNLGYCSKCGASWEFAVKGGLAYRLKITSSLKNNYACFVVDIDKLDSFSPIKVKLVIE